MFNILLIIFIVFAFILSFGIGYTLGSGKFVLIEKITEEDKELMEKQRKQMEEIETAFNDSLKSIMDYGGDNNG